MGPRLNPRRRTRRGTHHVPTATLRTFGDPKGNRRNLLSGESTRPSRSLNRKVPKITDPTRGRGLPWVSAKPRGNARERVNPSKELRPPPKMRRPTRGRTAAGPLGRNPFSRPTTPCRLSQCSEPYQCDAWLGVRNNATSGFSLTRTEFVRGVWGGRSSEGSSERRLRNPRKNRPDR